MTRMTPDKHFIRPHARRMVRSSRAPPSVYMGTLGLVCAPSWDCGLFPQQNMPKTTPNPPQSKTSLKTCPPKNQTFGASERSFSLCHPLPDRAAKLGTTLLATPRQRDDGPKRKPPEGGTAPRRGVRELHCRITAPVVFCSKWMKCLQDQWLFWRDLSWMMKTYPTLSNTHSCSFVWEPVLVWDRCSECWPRAQLYRLRGQTQNIYVYLRS